MSVYSENFETIFSDKNNIIALKNKVLELAIQGKLVEQNPFDEPASELVQKLQIERDRFVKEGIIKKQTPLEPIIKEDIPFEVPVNWEKVRLYEVSIIQEGPGIRTFQYKTDGVQFLTVTNILEGAVDFEKSQKYISEEEYLEKYKHFTLNRGDIVTACSGASWGKSAIYDSDYKMILNTSTLRLRFFADLADNKYLYYFIKSDYFKKQIESQLVGIQPNFGYAHYSKAVILLPPHKEQLRIIAKIESLMSEINKLEESLLKKKHLMELLPKAVVDAISKCQTGNEIREQLQFVIENFEIIFQTPESMKELRNVILQLAIEGKLVQQDPVDEPASELVKKIQVEKVKMVKEGRIKKQHLLEPIEEDEIPFEIPDNWEWVRLGNIAEINPRNSIDDELDVSFIPMKLMNEGYGSSHDFEIKKWKDLKSGFTHFAENDIAIAKITPCFENRKSAILTGLKSGFGAGTTEFHIVRTFSKLVSRKYLLYLFKTQWFIDSGTNTFTGTAGQQRISTNFINEYKIPLPSINEQCRIVQKVESMLNLIDQIENKFKIKVDLLEKVATV